MPEEMADSVLERVSRVADKIMSYKSQLFPVSGSRETPFCWTIHNSWESAPTDLPDILRDISRDIEFVHSWSVYDSRVRPGLELPRLNWNAVLGLTAATLVSAAFWAGIGLMIVHIWR